MGTADVARAITLPRSGEIPFGKSSWRVRRVSLRYHPSYPALVFPIGMYGAATFKMRAVIKLAGLEWASKVALAVAVTAWAVTFAGLVAQGGRAVSKLSRQRGSMGDHT